MTALLRKVFWVVLFLLSTFCFYVLFEHGTQNFPENAKTEYKNIKTLYDSRIQKKKDESDAAAK